MFEKDVRSTARNLFFQKTGLGSFFWRARDGRVLNRPRLSPHGYYRVQDEGWLVSDPRSEQPHSFACMCMHTYIRRHTNICLFHIGKADRAISVALRTSAVRENELNLAYQIVAGCWLVIFFISLQLLKYSSSD